MTYWDEDDRLVIRTSTQVPFHVRRQLAPVLGLPVKRIRVIKPRIGGGFGGKQEVLIEDVAAHLTIATGRPVRFEYTREEEFIAARSRHPMRIHMRTGVKRDGTITANEMTVLSDTGAYGCHALTVTGNTGHKAMALYVGDGPYRAVAQHPLPRRHRLHQHASVGRLSAATACPQGFWPVERHMERVARGLGLDPLEFRLKNALRSGELHPFSTAWSEGREPRPETINTCGLEECVRQGAAAIGWAEKYRQRGLASRAGQAAPAPRHRRGDGDAGHGHPLPGHGRRQHQDERRRLVQPAGRRHRPGHRLRHRPGAAGGRGAGRAAGRHHRLLVGHATSRPSTRAPTPRARPTSPGRRSCAPPRRWPSGSAAARGADAEPARGQAALRPEDIRLAERQAWAPDGRIVTLAEVGAERPAPRPTRSRSWRSPRTCRPVSPPPFAAQFAEVTVDMETGQVTVDRLVMAVDSGVIVNPLTASGQIEGGMTQALGYAVCEEMLYDEHGRARETDFADYHIFAAHEMPELQTIFVETIEPSPSLRGQGRGRDPDGRRCAGGRQRHPGCLRRRSVGDPDDAGARVARAATRGGLETRVCRRRGAGEDRQATRRPEREPSAAHEGEA